jgi:hypothetical protein
MQPDLEHLKFVREIALNDAEFVSEADRQYGGSWKQRGGVGAFFIFARKWDRLENAVRDHTWDVVETVRADQRPEGAIDDIRDLRRYLLLLEAWLMRQGICPPLHPKDRLPAPELPGRWERLGRHPIAAEVAPPAGLCVCGHNWGAHTYTGCSECRCRSGYAIPKPAAASPAPAPGPSPETHGSHGAADAVQVELKDGTRGYVAGLRPGRVGHDDPHDPPEETK